MNNEKSLKLDNMLTTITTNCEHGLLHIQVTDPFENKVGEMINPLEIQALIAFLEESLKQHINEELRN